MASSESTPEANSRPGIRSGGFRRAVLRGLGVVLPPLLTIVVLIWAWSTIESYVLTPIESWVRWGIVANIENTLSEIPAEAQPTLTPRRTEGFTYQGTRYVPDPTGRRYLPEDVKRLVDQKLGDFGPFTTAPSSANAYWHRYVQLRFLQRRFVVPIFLIVFTTALYFLGRIVTIGLGRWVLQGFERAILGTPLVSKVYGSVKQVTDFAFSEREIEFNRVVAIQYPRVGIWSIGFVTGNSIQGIADVTGEPMLSVLMPTSPMPMTGFTVTVKKSEAIDLDLTIDEAIQFVVSCGVVVPAQQLPAQSEQALKTERNTSSVTDDQDLAS
ncbi:MAG: DUF502 domain-containing protein [Rubripirellula sp.]|nr:DUF502 domain-containing protein [Rubripirellula sp.]